MADVTDAVEFMRQVNDAESENRQRGLEDLQFSFGSQWPEYAVVSRGLDRPQLTINETNVYIRSVCNAQRRQKPRGKASPVDSFADIKIAKTITGLGRHVEVNSDADNAYDTAFEFACRIGWGYWRLTTDYISEDSRLQDIFVRSIVNPFTVYFDNNSKEPDGSDAEKSLITDVMPIPLFKKKYPGAQTENFDALGTGDSQADWVTQQDIRLAEYFHVMRQKAKLVYLSDGTDVWEDKLPPKEILNAAGVTIQGDRQSFKRTVEWQKQTAGEVLEKRTLPGRWIPIVPVYWTRVVIDGKDQKFGLVKDAKDPARMNNFWWTAGTEAMALAPKAKWLVPEGADENHEKEWAAANISPNPVLRYKTTGLDGQPLPPPQRLQPEPPPTGMIEAMMTASNKLSNVMGVFDPAVRSGAQHKSDKTLNAERGQSENTNFDGFDNFTRSLKHSWRIMLSYFPVVYDTQRAARIIGADGKEEMVVLNERTQAQHPTTGEAIEKVLNDIRVGNYDVVMETGPNYDTQRQEGVAAMMQLLDTPLGEKVANVADDLVMRSMDFPGADIIADRMAAANPLSQIDEKIDIPPQAQMKMQAMQKMIEDLQKQLQAAGMELKYKGDLERFKQTEATKRTHLTAVAKAHDTEVWAKEETNQVQSVERTKDKEIDARRQTALDVEEIKGHIAILLARISERSAQQSSEETTERAV